MVILLLGGGGREHALAWAMAQNPKCGTLYAAPGNAGIAEVATCVACDILDPAAVVALSQELGADLVVVGPEAPLAAGVVDALEAAGIAVFGPRQAAAELESSKAFCKAVAGRAGVPTAAARVVRSEAEARAALAEMGAPIVVKADGLAAGKGVTVAETVEAAAAAIDALYAAGPATVLLEERLEGEEVSLFVLADGTACLPMGSAQDHKRAYEGDTGPNTGGMGAYSPAPAMTEALWERCLAEIIRPTLAEMVRMGRPYRGVLYAGLMLTEAGPRLIEYNVRFGDPEAQVLALRLGAQILDAIEAVATGRLGALRLTWAEDHALCVVMASPGYPGAAETGVPITALPAPVPGVVVFHAATRRDGDGVVSAGGRVLGVTARAGTLAAAAERAYSAVEAVAWAGGWYRRDIGWQAL